MIDRSPASMFVILGVLFAVLAVLLFSPVAERTMTSELVDRGPAPAGETVTSYSDLSQPVKEAVDEIIREEWTTFSTYEDHAVVEALHRTRYVEKGGDVYHIRTRSADGSGGLFEGLTHNTLLAVAGLLLGAAVYLRDLERQRKTVVAFPIISTAVVLGVNVLQAPDPSVINWIALTSFGISVAVPVLVGIAVRRRDLRDIGPAVVTLLVGIGVLFLGDAVSPLGILFGWGLLALPGTALGWWLESSARSTPTTQ